MTTTANNRYERIVEPASKWWADDEEDTGPTPRLDESVVGVVAGLLVTGLSGGPWSDGQHSVCEGCAGWLLDVDNDASYTGVTDAPVPCTCCTTKGWDKAQWAEFKVRMDRILAAWTVYYGGADEDLMAERRAWIRDRHAHQPTHLVG